MPKGDVERSVNRQVIVRVRGADEIDVLAHAS
ncbi:unnamed protein product [uncultured bacterium]|nr:unnamed protein product [uncultured bacterium]